MYCPRYCQGNMRQEAFDCLGTSDDSLCLDLWGGYAGGMQGSTPHPPVIDYYTPKHHAASHLPIVLVAILIAEGVVVPSLAAGLTSPWLADVAYVGLKPLEWMAAGICWVSLRCLYR